MMWTDSEVGMAMAHRRQTRAFANSAQALVDEMDTDIEQLRAQLAAARDVIRTERAGRLAAELRVQQLLDMPI